MHIAQGDSPSPLLYNFAAQVLLFKIELEPKIKSIRLRSFLPGPIKPSPPFENESNRETDKSDCFADDNMYSYYSSGILVTNPHLCGCVHK